MMPIPPVLEQATSQQHRDTPRKDDEVQSSDAPNPRPNAAMYRHERRHAGRDQDAPGVKKKSSRLAAVFAKLGLDAPTLMAMFK